MAQPPPPTTQPHSGPLVLLFGGCLLLAFAQVMSLLTFIASPAKSQAAFQGLSVPCRRVCLGVRFGGSSVSGGLTRDHLDFDSFPPLFSGLFFGASGAWGHWPQPVLVFFFLFSLCCSTQQCFVALLDFCSCWCCLLFCLPLSCPCSSDLFCLPRFRTCHTSAERNPYQGTSQLSVLDAHRRHE